MSKHAQFNDDGLPVAFYDNAIHQIPDNAVALDDEQYLELINNQGRRKFQDGQVTEYSPPPLSIDEKNELKATAIQAAMISEADPLFFQYQAGEATKKDWLDKRQEIKDRFK